MEREEKKDDVAYLAERITDIFVKEKATTEEVLHMTVAMLAHTLTLCANADDELEEAIDFLRGYLKRKKN